MQSPLSDPFSLHQSCGISVSATGTIAHAEFAEDSSSPFHSSYSTLVGWAGDAFSQNPGCSLPFVVAQPPLVYDSDSVGVMKAAFDAATHAVYGGWNAEFGLGPVAPDHSYDRWDDLDGIQRLTHWSQTGLQEVRCRQDNAQLSEAERSARFVRQA